MSANDYVKFVTEQIVGYISEPKAERKRKKKTRKANRAPFLSHWFGLIPVAILIGLKKRKD